MEVALRERVVIMQSILIVEPSDVLRKELVEELQKDYLVYSCTRGDEGLALYTQLHPDGLILNLYLESIDGVYFLECLDKPPKAILTLSPTYSPVVYQRLLDLGVSHALMLTCPIRAIARHTRYFMENVPESLPPTAQERATEHLHKLHVPNWSGFDDLRIAIPLFAQDPSIGIVKELYPAVVVLRGRDNWKQVEKAIRHAKEYAYTHRNDAVWSEYFPNTSHCPTNKEFIARLAEFIK